MKIEQRENKLLIISPDFEEIAIISGKAKTLHIETGKFDRISSHETTTKSISFDQTTVENVYLELYDNKEIYAITEGKVKKYREPLREKIPYWKFILKGRYYKLKNNLRRNNEK